jgi:hypothetical protein
MNVGWCWAPSQPPGILGHFGNSLMLPNPSSGDPSRRSWSLQEPGCLSYDLPLKNQSIWNPTGQKMWLAKTSFCNDDCRKLRIKKKKEIQFSHSKPLCPQKTLLMLHIFLSLLFSEPPMFLQDLEGKAPLLWRCRGLGIGWVLSKCWGASAGQAYLGNLGRKKGQVFTS